MIASSDDFEQQWAAASETLDGADTDDAARAARLDQWRAQEWHDWFRWVLCARGFDWSKPLWMGVLGGGIAALVAYGYATGRWEITAGGGVGWFTIVNLGFFSYLGLRTRRPPMPIPGPFRAGQLVRAEAAVYPAGYDGRKLPRLWLRIARADVEPWLIELSFANAVPKDLASMIASQATFRMQRTDAPRLRAVCEALDVTRAQIDAGAHPIKVVAWSYDETATDLFGRPVS